MQRRFILFKHVILFISCFFMHRTKCRSRWQLVRHSFLFVSFRRASDSLLPVLRRTRQDSIQSNAPWETQIDFWNFSSDVRQENLTRSMSTIDWKANFHSFQQLVQHLKSYDRFLLDHPRRKERTFSEFIFNDLSFSLTSLSSRSTSQTEKKRETSSTRATSKYLIETSNQFTSVMTLEYNNLTEKHLMQKLFEGKKTAYAPEQLRMESSRIRANFHIFHFLHFRFV